MVLSRFYFSFRFLLLTLFILNYFAEQLLSKKTFSRMGKSETSPEKSKILTQYVEKAAKRGRAKNF